VGDKKGQGREKKEKKKEKRGREKRRQSFYISPFSIFKYQYSTRRGQGEEPEGEKGRGLLHHSSSSISLLLKREVRKKRRWEERK